LISCFLIFIGLAIYAFGIFARLKDGGFTDPNSESDKVGRYFTKYYEPPSPDIVVILEQKNVAVNTEEFKTNFYNYKSDLQSKIPEAFGIMSYFDYPYLSGLLSKDGFKTILTFRLNKPEDFTIEDFKQVGRDSNFIIHYGGNDIVNTAVGDGLSQDLIASEIGSIPVLILLLFLAYGGVVATLPAILLALWTFIMTLAALNMVTEGFNVSTYVSHTVVYIIIYCFLNKLFVIKINS
jgi:RND superfamily putative drug exporter